MKDMLIKLNSICSKLNLDFNEVFKSILESNNNVSYETLYNKIEIFIEEKSEKIIKEKKEQMKKILKKYGYSKAICNTNLKSGFTEGKVYPVLYAFGLNNSENAIIFNDNFDLVRLNNKWLEYEEPDSVRILKIKKNVKIAVTHLEISKEDFLERCIYDYDYAENKIYYNWEF